MMLFRVPLARSPLAMLSSSLAASGAPDGSRCDARQGQDLVGLGALEAPGGLVGRALAEDDQVERVARDLQAVFQALDQAEEDARRRDQEARPQDGHQRRLPADPEVADVVLDRDHDVQTTFLRPLITDELAAKSAGKRPLTKPTKSETPSPKQGDVPGHVEERQEPAGVGGDVDEIEEGLAAQRADHSAEPGDQHRLGEHQEEHQPLGKADGLEHGHLGGPLAHGHRHGVARDEEERDDDGQADAVDRAT